MDDSTLRAEVERDVRAVTRDYKVGRGSSVYIKDLCGERLPLWGGGGGGGGGRGPGRRRRGWPRPGGCWGAVTSTGWVCPRTRRRRCAGIGCRRIRGIPGPRPTW